VTDQAFLWKVSQFDLVTHYFVDIGSELIIRGLVHAFLKVIAESVSPLYWMHGKREFSDIGIIESNDQSDSWLFSKK
jgi:hypothetical protein